MSSLNPEANICERAALISVALRTPIRDSPRRLPQNGQTYCLCSLVPDSSIPAGIMTCSISAPQSHVVMSLLSLPRGFTCRHSGHSQAGSMLPEVLPEVVPEWLMGNSMQIFLSPLKYML